MYFKQLTGKWGEDLACAYLKKQNYTIIERNFSCYQGEIDIIAKDPVTDELVFIEVKTRTNLEYGYPIDSVTRSKQKHLYRACCYYLYSHDIYTTFIRVDVIEIFVKNQTPHIRHTKQIF